MTIGERIAPTIVIVTIGDSDSHATHMCRAPPKPSPTPSPQPVICIYCGSSEHRLMEVQKPSSRQQRGRSHSQPSIQWVLQRQTTETCHRRLATVHIKPMLGPKIAKKLGPQVTNRGDQRQADNTNNHHNAPHRANQIIKINFLTGIIGIVTSRDKHVSTRSKIKGILHITLPLPLPLSAGSDLLSHSIMQLAETQSRSLEIFVAPTKISNRGVPRTN